MTFPIDGLHCGLLNGHGHTIEDMKDAFFPCLPMFCREHIVHS